MAHTLNAPGGFIRAPKLRVRTSVYGGKLREIQDSEIVTSAKTLVADDLLSGLLEVDSAADASATTSITTPTPAQMITAGLKIGDYLQVALRNNKTAAAVTLVAGENFTALGNVTLGPASRGILHMVILTATTGFFYLEKLGLPSVPANPITATVTLTAADSGRSFGITQGASVIAVTLPDPAQGLTLDFVFTTAGAANVTFSTGDTDLWGILYVGVNPGGPSNAVQVDNNTTITAVGGAIAAGDFIRFIGVDSSTYLVFANSSLATDPAWTVA